MKILSLILDGHGRVSAELCVSPDLKRREIVAATGAGHLIWCGLAARSQQPGEVLEELRGYIRSRNLDRWDRPSLRAAIRKAYLVTLILPAVSRVEGRIRRTAWRHLTAPVQKLLRGLAQARRTP